MTAFNYVMLLKVNGRRDDVFDFREKYNLIRFFCFNQANFS